MKWYRLYKESNDSDFVIKNGVLEVYKGLATKVKIPNIVTSIGNCAFGYHANLESVIIIK